MALASGLRGSSLQSVTAHPFLSPEWIVEARKIRDAYADRAPDPTEEIRANLVITDAPFTDAEIEGHVDTTGGSIIVDEGHIEDPEITVKTDYDTAKTLFVDRDPSGAMEAFMMGKVLVTGDVSRVLAFASTPPPTDPDELALANEIASRLSDITAG